jgi:PAS domain S-box-containing protein
MRRKRAAQAALMSSRAALERAESLAHFGSWQWDMDGNRVEWSAELHHIYGLKPGTFEGTLEGYLTRVHPDDRERVANTITAALHNRTSFAMRERIVRPDGSVRVLSSVGDVVAGPRGAVRGMFGACHDVTDQETAQDERVRADRDRQAMHDQMLQSQKLEAVGRLAGGIAHDFNNMLLVILGSVSLLLDRKTDADPEWKDLRAIEDSAERASNLTRQLLTVARRQVFSGENVDLNAVIRDMEEMLRRSLGGDIRFEFSLSPDALAVHADPSQLHQVLLNLVVNARDAMPDGGTLTLSTRGAVVEEQPVAIVEVADTGHGMDEEVLAHLFEPFFTTKGPAGTGLGLATIYGIVTQSGGRIDVRSTAGEGTTFTVSLPRVAQEDAPAENAPPTWPAGGAETVLIVDDAEPVLALTSRILSGVGYQVLTAPSGAWALSVAQRHPAPIDLLLTDVMMPGMSGPQLARRMAGLRPNLRVLYMTGYQRSSTDGESLVGPGALLIEKPFKPTALLEAVREALTSQKM